MTHIQALNRPPADEAARVRMAASAGTSPHMLRILAADEAVTVRAAVALNPGHAPAADLHLLGDPDERVRALLALKLTGILPGLSRAEHAAAQDHVHATLLALANDAAVRVRAAIADALHAMPDAPREVILRLAQDSALEVSHPVLRLSPLLTDSDLLELLATPAHAGTASAVASRAGLSGVVCEHICRHADSAAVRIMLENTSAAIQEATLDALVGRAADYPEWHEPLARHPVLPLHAVHTLSRFVASHVLDTLARRAELPPDVLKALSDRVAASLADATVDLSETELLKNVQDMAAAGELNEAALMEAADAGDNRMVAILLAVASSSPLEVIDRAVSLRSAKALISLVWKAGFSIRAAHAVQATLGQLAPRETIGPGPQDAFPLSGDEMAWQIELLGEPGR